MGPLGVEGFYRSACESTVRVIRHQKNAMMSVLKPFLHDPLVEWQKEKACTYWLTHFFFAILSSISVINFCSKLSVC